MMRDIRKSSKIRGSSKFFYITDLFRLSAKDWAKLLNELDCMTMEQRDALLHGRDDEYGYGYE